MSILDMSENEMQKHATIFNIRSFNTDEILSETSHSTELSGGLCYLWQHSFDAESLVTWTERNKPHLKIEDYLSLRPKRLVERLSVRILLDTMCPAATTLEHLPSGAPYLPEFNLPISISHTRGCYGLSMSTQRHGIDLEQWGNKALRVRSMFIRDDEQAIFNSWNETFSPENTATLLWSAKESVYKLFDIPGLSFLDDIHLSLESPETLHVNIPRLDTAATVYFRIYPTFVFTYATLHLA